MENKEKQTNKQADTTRTRELRKGRSNKRTDEMSTQTRITPSLKQITAAQR